MSTINNDEWKEIRDTALNLYPKKFMTNPPNKIDNEIEKVVCWSKLTIAEQEDLKFFVRAAVKSNQEKLLEEIGKMKEKCPKHDMDETYCFSCQKCIDENEVKGHHWQYAAGLSDVEAKIKETSI